MSRRGLHRRALAAFPRHVPPVIAMLLTPLAMSAPSVAAQTVEPTATVEGVVIDAESGAGLAGANIRIEGRPVGDVTHADGTFHILRLAFGVHTLFVERLGYATTEVEITVGPETPEITIEMRPSPLDLEGVVVTGTLSERAADETLRPVGVLTGQDLQRQLRQTVSETLAAEPGVASSTMGPAITRPVIRGLSGDRVLMLEDGVRVADVSNTSSDHPTAVDPTSARRIEVVRGPAALLYGSNALGGVINVIRDEVPGFVPDHTMGSATAQTRTVNSGYGLSGTMFTALTDNVPLRVEATGRSSGDLNTPVGNLLNTDAETWSAAVGTGWVGERASVGAAARALRSDFGVPGGFEGGHAAGVRTEMERAAGKLRARIDDPLGPFGSLQIDGLFSDYRHTEFETADIVGTIFERTIASADAIARAGEWGPFSAGAIGGRASWEDLAYRGQLSTPDSRRYAAAAFVFGEIDLGSVRIESGLRYDWVRINPGMDDPDASIGNVRERTFHSASGSLGFLYNFADGFTAGASVAQAFRPPDVGELYSEGPHLAAYSFEVGNPDLETEIGRGFDAFVRYGTDELRAELTGFHYGFSGYIYGENTGRISRVQLPIYQFQSNDAALSGFEGSLHWEFADGFELESIGSYVRGSLSDTDEPLPLIPPFQGIVALAHDRTTWFVRGESEFAADQNRISEFEETTQGYTTFNFAAGLRLTIGGRLNVLTLSVENITDEEYRNHLSRVKEIMPEAGRGLDLTYRVVF